MATEAFFKRAENRKKLVKKIKSLIKDIGDVHVVHKNSSFVKDVVSAIPLILILAILFFPSEINLSDRYVRSERI